MGLSRNPAPTLDELLAMLPLVGRTLISDTLSVPLSDGPWTRR